ncbi:MAG TPA: HPP family protein [Pseudomonas sp.]|nr:HPP family protein [Pseudomonas sp.]
MALPVSSLHAWLVSFLPTSASSPRPREWLRATLGTVLALAFCTWLNSQWYGLPTTLYLLGPLAASALLLFAVPSGALAQPWSLLGSYLVAGLSAALVGHFAGGATLLAAALAPGLALLLMYLLRCLHPPGGAMALCLIVGGADLHASGLALMLQAFSGALVLLVGALLYNNLTGVRYPKAPLSASELHGTRDPLPEQRAGFSPEDLRQALDEFDGFVDVTPEDLEQLLRSTEHHALRRRMGDINAAQIMSRDLRIASPTTTVDQALAMLKHHRLRNLPVLENSRLVGIVSVIDLIGQSRRRQPWPLSRRRETQLSEVMTSPAVSVEYDLHLAELIALMSGQGLHCVPVLENQVLVGMITQTDLIAALQQDLLHQAA